VEDIGGGKAPKTPNGPWQAWALRAQMGGNWWPAGHPGQRPGKIEGGYAGVLFESGVRRGLVPMIGDTTV